MECGLFALLMQGYHDGELDAAARAEYEQHRRSCGACRRLDERYARVVASLSTMPLHEPSPGFDRAVLSRVDIGAYRVSPVRRFFRAIERRWNAAPIPLRNGALVGVVCAAVIAVYKPLFDYIVVTVGGGAGSLWAGMLMARDVLARAAGVWKASEAVRNYEVVGQMILRTLHRATVGVGPAEATAIAALIALVAILLYRTFGSTRSKGETHVGIV